MVFAQLVGGRRGRQRTGPACGRLPSGARAATSTDLRDGAPLRTAGLAPQWARSLPDICGVRCMRSRTLTRQRSKAEDGVPRCSRKAISERDPRRQGCRSRMARGWLILGRKRQLEPREGTRVAHLPDIRKRPKELVGTSVRRVLRLRTSPQSLVVAGSLARGPCGLRTWFPGPSRGSLLEPVWRFYLPLRARRNVRPGPTPPQQACPRSCM